MIDVTEMTVRNLQGKVVAEVIYQKGLTVEQVFELEPGFRTAKTAAALVRLLGSIGVPGVVWFPGTNDRVVFGPER